MPLMLSYHKIVYLYIFYFFTFFEGYEMKKSKSRNKKFKWKSIIEFFESVEEQDREKKIEFILDISGIEFNNIVLEDKGDIIDFLDLFKNHTEIEISNFVIQQCLNLQNYKDVFDIWKKVSSDPRSFDTILLAKRCFRLYYGGKNDIKR